MSTFQNDQTLKTKNIHDAALSQESPVWEYLAILFRGKWIVLITTALVIVLVTIYNYTAKPIYEAKSTVLIDVKGKNGNLTMLDMNGAAMTNNVTNEIEILKSASVAQNVADALLSKVFIDDAKTKIIPILLLNNKDTKRDTFATSDAIRSRLLNVCRF